MRIDSSILRWSSSGVKRLSRSHAEQDFLSIGYRYQEACNALDIYFFNYLYLLSETIVNELSIAM